MDKKYFITNDIYGGVVIWFDEGQRRISFTEAPGNRHYEEYLEWVAEGNTPEVIND